MTVGAKMLDMTKTYAREYASMYVDCVRLLVRLHACPSDRADVADTIFVCSKNAKRRDDVYTFLKCLVES